MKKIISTVFLICLAVSLFAENLSVQSICKGLAKHPNTTGDFVQIKTINTNGRQLKSSGEFIISLEGIMWKTLKPFPSSLVVTKENMIQTGADGKKTVMSGADNQVFQNIAETLTSIFAGDNVQLEKNFETKLTLQENGGWSILLTPKDSMIAAVMKSLNLSGFEKASEIILTSLDLQENSSNKIHYDFQNQKYPKELTEDEKANFAVN